MSSLVPEPELQPESDQTVLTEAVASARQEGKKLKTVP